MIKSFITALKQAFKQWRREKRQKLIDKLRAVRVEAKARILQLQAEIDSLI